MGIGVKLPRTVAGHRVVGVEAHEVSGRPAQRLGLPAPSDRRIVVAALGLGFSGTACRAEHPRAAAEQSEK